MKKEDLYKQYAIDSNLKTYHYKVLFLLMDQERTQSELCTELSVSKQNINKICKALLTIGYVSNGRLVGRNKYLKINPNPRIQLKGQLTVVDIEWKKKTHL